MLGFRRPGRRQGPLRGAAALRFSLGLRPSLDPFGGAGGCRSHGSDALLWPRLGPGIRSWGNRMDERAEFRDEVTLSRNEVLDVVARCEEVAIYAEGIGEVSVAVSIDSVRRFLLGRLQGAPGGLDD